VSPGQLTPGRRVMPREDGWLPELGICEYGRVDVAKTVAACASRGHPVTPDHPWMHWRVRSPDGVGGRLDPSIHRVTEHEDGTITVSPSIAPREPGGWHGFLERGVWREC
jgi:Family of unknown function (DUF6527)